MPTVRRRSRLLILLAAILVGALGVGAWTTGMAGDDEVTLAVTAPVVDVRGGGDGAVLAPVHHFLAAESLVPALEVFADPDPAIGTVPMSVSSNPTHEGFPLIMSVLDQSADGAWLRVHLPQRPNGYAGWVRAADVRSYGVPNRIVVSIAERTLRVYDGDSDDVLFQTLVAVGADRTPTPLGDFFIDIVNPLGGHRVYGWGQLSVSGFSDVLQSFGGGIGQIAIHGWNDPSAMGRNVSNGCVRMNNDDIARVAELSPVGTPVQIVA